MDLNEPTTNLPESGIVNSNFGIEKNLPNQLADDRESDLRTNLEQIKLDESSIEQRQSDRRSSINDTTNQQAHSSLSSDLSSILHDVSSSVTSNQQSNQTIDHSHKQTDEDLSKQLNKLDPINLVSDTFSQTNTDRQSDDDGEPNLINFDTDESSTKHSRHRIQQDRTSESSETDARGFRLDPYQLSSKLLDLNAIQTGYERTAGSPFKSRFDLPDLITSDDRKPPQEDTVEKTTSTTDDDIPSYQVKWIKFRGKQCAIITQVSLKSVESCVCVIIRLIRDYFINLECEWSLSAARNRKRTFVKRQNQSAIINQTGHLRSDDCVPSKFHT